MNRKRRTPEQVMALLCGLAMGLFGCTPGDGQHWSMAPARAMTPGHWGQS
jgi:hypothetical protein